MGAWFTTANKHLPEVPSAKEMPENGVDLAAMNMVLLKKVEELTLHAIALQKDVEAQKATLADQQKNHDRHERRPGGDARELNRPCLASACLGGE